MPDQHAGEETTSRPIPLICNILRRPLAHSTGTTALSLTLVGVRGLPGTRDEAGPRGPTSALCRRVLLRSGLTGRQVVGLGSGLLRAAMLCRPNLLCQCFQRSVITWREGVEGVSPPLGHSRGRLDAHHWCLLRSALRNGTVVQETVAQLGELNAEGRAGARAFARTITGPASPPT